jgi:hypothetical protein
MFIYLRKVLQISLFGVGISLIFTHFTFAQRIPNTQKEEKNKGLFSIQTSVSPNSPEKNGAEDGLWIHWDDGENANAVGNNQTINFSVASRWEPQDLVDYNGMYITKISFFPNYEDCVYSLKIWTDTIAEETYSQLVSDIVVAEWNVVELEIPYLIDASMELWIGYNIDTEGGYPAGCDAGPEVAGKGNMVYFNDEWSELTTINPDLTYNWNIQAYVTETPPPKMYNVTFNVAMTYVEGFDPEENSVYLTGSFTEWAEPGTEGSIVMERVNEPKSTSVVYHESWENFEDFTTELTPWITHLVNDDMTWTVNDFDFPGEEQAFAFMVFNPTQTVPDISDIHPAFNGDKYLIAIQSMTVNDNKWLISPAISVCETCVLSFAAKSITDSYGLERIRVLISTEGADTTDFVQISEGDYIEVPAEWTEFNFDLNAYADQEVHVAIQYISYDSFIFMMDDFKVSYESSEPDELIYTTTLEVQEGSKEYKYFSDAFGEGWEGAEWEGDPNRVIDIQSNITVNDIWGYPASYFEANILSFAFEEGQDDVEISDDYIIVWLAEDTDATALTPIISITEGATINYEYPTVMDFTNPVEFEVIAEDQTTTKTYSVHIWTTGVESDILSNLKVYPNPFNDNIFISLADKVSRVIITNITGQVVMDVPLHSPQISTSHLSKGVYLVIFYANNGERVVRKMIKN